MSQFSHPVSSLTDHQQPAVQARGVWEQPVFTGTMLGACLGSFVSLATLNQIPSCVSAFHRFGPSYVHAFTPFCLLSPTQFAEEMMLVALHLFRIPDTDVALQFGDSCPFPGVPALGECRECKQDFCKLLRLLCRCCCSEPYICLQCAQVREQRRLFSSMTASH